MGSHHGVLLIQPRDRFYAMQDPVPGRPQFYFENDPKQIDFFIIKSLFGVVIVYLSHIVFWGLRVHASRFKVKDIHTITATPSWSGSWMI